MPDTPTIEPTERSIPAVRITKVMPMAMIALIATCWARMTSVGRSRKFGVVRPKKAKTTISAMNVRKLISSSASGRFFLAEAASEGSVSLVMMLVFPSRSARGNSAQRRQ